jgi:hypothetical protein
MHRTSTASPVAANGNATTVVEFTLKPRNSKLRLSATHITATTDESQHLLCKRIADIAHLPTNRLRVVFENSNRVIDKRAYKENPPKVRDITNEGTVLIVKDLGTSPDTPNTRSPLFNVMIFRGQKLVRIVELCWFFLVRGLTQ